MVKLPNNIHSISIRYLFNRLGVVGYISVANRNNEPLVEFQQGEIEILAEMEHLRWMKQKFEEVWKYSTTTDKVLNCVQICFSGNNLLTPARKITAL